MAVYRTPNTKKQRKISPALLVLLAAAVVVAAVVILSAVSNRQAITAMADSSSSEELVSGEGPEAALEAIYAQSEVRGVSALNSKILDEKFGVVPETYLKAWGRYSDGTYGIADVFIFRTVEGQKDALRESLEQVKTARIVETQNYDIYNSLEYAEEGQIFEAGDYMCLIMIENADQVRETLEDFLLDD